MMMTSCLLPWIAVVCGFSSVCVSVGGEMPETSAVSVSMHLWSVKNEERGAGPKLEVELKAVEKADWKIAYCGVDKSGLFLTDSEGLSSPRLAGSYREARMSERSEKMRKISLPAESWLPSANARWIKVTGEMPVAVFRTSAVSEPVSLKLVKGFSVPLMLKGAGMDGADVEVKLKVVDFEEDRYRKNHFNLTIRVASGAGIGILDADVHAQDGVSPKKRYEYAGMSSDGSYVWRKMFVLDGGREGELNVSLTYATGLKSIVVPVQGLGGLFGMSGTLEIKK